MRASELYEVSIAVSVLLLQFRKGYGFLRVSLASHELFTY